MKKTALGVLLRIIGIVTIAASAIAFFVTLTMAILNVVSYSYARPLAGFFTALVQSGGWYPPIVGIGGWICLGVGKLIDLVYNVARGSQKTKETQNSDDLDLLVQYKKLLDQNAITKEEYDAKKRAILKL